MKDFPCTAEEALARAQRGVDLKGQYLLGTGDYTNDAAPWTSDGYSRSGSDCAGFAICWAWKLVRHRPGFNHGPWSTVEDDINVNSAIEDAEHNQELFTIAVVPRPGDLLCYPTFRYAGKVFIGHVALIERVPPQWLHIDGYHQLTVIQCHGPDGWEPGIARTDGSHWDTYEHNWPRVFSDPKTGQWVDPRVKIVRPKERS